MPAPASVSPVQSPAPRAVLSLDGTWEFATDPERLGEKEAWFLPQARWPAMPRPGYAPAADGKIQVPGIWDHQGYGTPTDKVRHNFVGLGWYRRQQQIPEAWTGRRLFLRLGGAHRSAKAWVNGHYLGEHIGYLSEFEMDITPHAPLGSTATLVIAVDSRQRHDVDTLFGASDLADYMDVAWGGLWGHVTLEGRGGAWLRDLFLQTRLADSRCTATAELEGSPGAADGLRLEVFDLQNNLRALAVRRLERAQAAGASVDLSATVSNAQPWSPETPVLYRARLSLLEGDRVLDTLETRFGLRELRLEGPAILLNGKRLFLRGYGDDHIYPDRMAMPSDKELHLKRLRVIKSYGFNHVRHHSTILPPEYYEACDEVGIMPTAEFPIAYDSFLPGGANWKKNVIAGSDPAPAFDTYTREWAAAIKRHRNHPSILAWVMGNELWAGIPLRHEFKRIACQLDPARPFADTDGVTQMWQQILDPKKDRDTLDLYFLMFDVFHNPLELPDKFQTPRPIKPVISHESGNYVTFTRPDLIAEFRHNIKPFWMTDGRARLEKLGLLPEASQWAEKSERLYLLLHKTNLEALRQNPFISGYHWWLFQDYWTTANGLVDHYFRPKAITPAEVRRFNNEVVLLQNGLDLTYRGGASLKVKLLLSNFSPLSLGERQLQWELRAGDQVLATAQAPVRRADSGELSEVTEVNLVLPEAADPTQLKLRAGLTRGGGWSNDWTAWLYPKEAKVPVLPVPHYGTGGQLKRWPHLGLQPIPREGPLPSPAVYVAGSPNPRLLDAVERGACLLLLNEGRHFRSRPLTYRSSWWKAGDDLNANLCGTFVYEHPVTRPIAPDGWCDAGWFHLIEGGRKMSLDPLPARPGVIIRALPSLRAVEDEAILFEVGLGEGALLVSGLNHSRARGRPENDWLLASLVRYAATLPKPKVRWARSAVPAPAVPALENALSGFARVLRNEGEEGVWYSYCEDNVAMRICRQTKPGNLVEWETANLTADWTGERVTFVFAGGLGYSSQPKTEGFVFMVNGQDQCRFDLAGTYPKWASADGRVALQFFPLRHVPEDELGLFHVTVERRLLQPGHGCRFGVRSLGSGSRRWFGLNLYSDPGTGD